MPFIGFHPSMVITMLIVHGAYSFFTHTQLIGKIKWLEYVFVTPSVHGVHHASDEKYLDKIMAICLPFGIGFLEHFKLKKKSRNMV